jgi:hypothetical protein
MKKMRIVLVATNAREAVTVRTYEQKESQGRCAKLSLFHVINFFQCMVTSIFSN